MCGFYKENVERGQMWQNDEVFAIPIKYLLHIFCLSYTLLTLQCRVFLLL